MRLLLLAAGIAVAGCAQDRALLDQYCVTCHNEKLKTGGLALDQLDPAHPAENAVTWEKVVRKLRAGMMPPSGARRPDRPALDAFTAKLETGLDRAAAANPDPGATALHRLNRNEYANAIRDLLALELDTTTLLPPDDSSEGFDNIAEALGVSPALLERYVAAATKISRIAVGDPAISPLTSNYRVPGDLRQADHIEGLPLGTRGGILVRHTFPLDAEYEFKIRTTGGGTFQTVGRDEELEVTLNGARVKLVKAAGPIDFKLPMKAGPQTLGVALLKKNAPGTDDLWQVIPNSSGVQSIAIMGPLNATGPGDTPSRRRIFVCHPAAAGEETACAKEILSTLARRAFRRQATDADLETLLSFYQSGRNEGNFEAGVERALARILVDPRFVFRFEREPANLPSGAVYRVSDLELASRLSFFLWSSIPDEPLLTVALSGRLTQPAVLEQQVRRMLADRRADALIDNFAEQWLFLRNLKSSAPNLDAFPDFDDNLRQAMRQETKLFFGSILREDRSILDLINADYTFVNERLARHYGIPNIYGSQFRRITVTDPARRGLLGQASILTVTSYPNRTSPVQRGKWILTNLLGVPPQPPPPNVPELKDNGGAAKPLSLRERMEAHRANTVCAGCHKVMDPIGFSLENFDAVGRWRSTDDGAVIDPSGVLFNGASVTGPATLREMISSRPQVFAGVLTEKMLTYALGRSLEPYDMPAVRKIVRETTAHGYQFVPLITAIVESVPFQMRMKRMPETSLASAKE